MSGEHACFDGGCIAPPRFAIPPDPSVYMKSENPTIGCNRIRCRDCKAWVRHRDNTWLAPWPTTRAEQRWVYDHLGELEPPKVEYGPAYRLYVCHCDYYTAVSPKQLWTLEQGWECAGHPEPE